MKILRFYFFFALSVGWLVLGGLVARASTSAYFVWCGSGSSGNVVTGCASTSVQVNVLITHGGLKLVATPGANVGHGIPPGFIVIRVYPTGQPAPAAQACFRNGSHSTNYSSLAYIRKTWAIPWNLGY